MGKGEQFREMLVAGRKAAGLTQMEATIALGMRQPVSISRWENGGYMPEPPTFERIIALYALDADKAWELWGLAYAERVRAALGELEG